MSHQQRTGKTREALINDAVGISSLEISGDEIRVWMANGYGTTLRPLGSKVGRYAAAQEAYRALAQCYRVAYRAAKARVR